MERVIESDGPCIVSVASGHFICSSDAAEFGQDLCRYRELDFGNCEPVEICSKVRQCVDLFNGIVTDPCAFVGASVDEMTSFEFQERGPDDGKRPVPFPFVFCVFG